LLLGIPYFRENDKIQLHQFLLTCVDILRLVLRVSVQVSILISFFVFFELFQGCDRSDC
jgi:hypothetical protein